MKEYSCVDCVTGITMCKNMPCRPTPEEAVQLIEAGYKKRLIIETRYDLDDQEVEIIKPMSQNGKTYGRCTFLTKDDRCEIQDLKPLEGRTACCKAPDDGYSNLVKITDMWATAAGRKIADGF